LFLKFILWIFSFLLWHSKLWNFFFLFSCYLGVKRLLILFGILFSLWKCSLKFHQ